MHVNEVLTFKCILGLLRQQLKLDNQVRRLSTEGFVPLAWIAKSGVFTKTRFDLNSHRCLLYCVTVSDCGGFDFLIIDGFECTAIKFMQGAHDCYDNILFTHFCIN